MAAVACTTKTSARFVPRGQAVTGLRPFQRPGVHGRRMRTCATGSGTNGSHPQQQHQQQPVLDELMLALMQRRAQQGQPPLAHVPPAPPASASPAPPLEQLRPESDTSADLPQAAAQLVASAEAAPTSIAVPGPAPAAALALAAYEDALAQRPLALVRFSLRLRVQPGERVRLVGSGDELGKWDALAAPELRCIDGDMWQAALQLPTGCIVEYKYVILDASGRSVLSWQDGNNNVLAVRLSDESLDVTDNWHGDMRGEIVSAGGTVETRESRLLAWAGDLFAQLSSQRAELRRSRLEVAGAKEAEQEARAEAGFFKAQNKVKEAERAEAAAALAEVQALNRAMEEQLTDTTQALLEAIETADALLTANENDDGSDASAAEEAAPAEVATAVEQPARRRGRRSAAAAAAVDAPVAEAPAVDAPATPKRGRPRKAAAAAATTAAAPAAGEPAAEGAAAAAAAVAAPKTRRRRATKVASAE
ncbi:hypothetical protein ABPG77_010190 [Micractinium sp. CCAP 211/92]